MNWKQPKVYAVKHKDEMTRAASRCPIKAARKYI